MEEDWGVFWQAIYRSIGDARKFERSVQKDRFQEGRSLKCSIGQVGVTQVGKGAFFFSEERLSSGVQSEICFE